MFSAVEFTVCLILSNSPLYSLVILWSKLPTENWLRAFCVSLIGITTFSTNLFNPLIVSFQLPEYVVLSILYSRFPSLAAFTRLFISFETDFKDNCISLKVCVAITFSPLNSIISTSKLPLPKLSTVSNIPSVSVIKRFIAPFIDSTACLNTPEYLFELIL